MKSSIERRRADRTRRDAWSADTEITGEMLTPIGPLRLTVGPRGVKRIDLPNGNGNGHPGGNGAPATPDRRIVIAKAQLREYFDGKRTEFDLPLELEGTPFDRAVWRAVAQIPFGRTATYGEIAAKIGAPRAVRAVGAANGRNPVPLIVPCHRVIGSGGRLTGYGGGLELKAALLRLEGRAFANDKTVSRGTRVLPAAAARAGRRAVPVSARPASSRKRARGA